MADKTFIKKGYLNKQGGGFKTWKRRWFTLEEGDILYLSYFPNEKEEGALGTLDLSQCRAVRPVTSRDTAKAFYFEVDAPDRTYLINADSGESRDDWVQIIESGLERMQLKRDGGEIGEATKAGYLWKQGGAQGNKGWRRRWFVMQNDNVMYYKTENDKKILGRFTLGQCNSIVPAEPAVVKREFCFKLGFSGRVYIIGAEDAEERDEWMEAMGDRVPETAQRGGPTVGGEDDDVDDDSPAPASSGSQTALGTDEMVAAREEADKEPIVKQGYLSKTGGTIKTVKRRWFVLRGSLLSYYQTENEKDPLGTIDLKKCRALRTVEESRGRPHSLELLLPKRTYTITAENDADREEWKLVIEEAIPEEPEADDEEATNFASRALSETAKIARRASSRLFAGDAASAPVESDPNAVKMLANSADDDDNTPASPTSSGPRSMLDLGALKSGWMMKQGGSVKTWKRRFFVLRGLALAYYKTDQDPAPQGIIDLTQCTSVEKKENPTVKGAGWAFEVITRARTFALEAETESARQQWIGAIGSVVDAKNRPDQAALIASKREGYLEKRGGANKAWKRRYFVVLGTRLFYFPDEKRERPLGAIDLKECFGLYSVPLQRHGRPNVFELVTPDRIYAVVGDSEEIRDGWMSLIADMIPAGEPVTTAADGESFMLKEGQVKAGVLEKRPSDPKSTWAKRYTVLNNAGQLLLYRTDKDNTPIQVIELNTCAAVREVPRGTVDRPFALSIQGKGDRVFYLAAPSQSVQAEWISEIRGYIPTEEMRAAEAEVEPVLMCGYLNKMGGSRKSWRKRWFVFRGTTMRYYKSPKDDEELGSISLNQVADTSCLKSELKLDVSNGFAVITPDRTYYLGAETEDIRSAWLGVLRKYLEARGPVDPLASSPNGDDD